MAIDGGWAIPEDSVVRLASSGLLAAVVLNIERGASPAPLAPGSEIASEPPSDVFASVGALADDLARLVRDQIAPLVSSLGERAPAVMENLDGFSAELAHILSEENHERIERILGNLDQSSDGLRSLVSGLAESRARMDGVLGSLDALIEESGPDLQASLADLRVSLESLARRSDAITHHLEVTTRNFNEFSSEIRRDPSLLLRGRDGEEPVEGE
jgi:phospholipid/cholesterol/gamma-HCH transport system substrate-binding protein